ncbi:hypothetical protein B0T24DRAFT_598081 [Lasiosphaeria ovina]|uniref:Uncharacterized protein n=1 Tax=Lasiosphaeria ovina TaxID=92902 RepID=A0AAE0JUN0_9PEZI|nr:hypothetical protein B0T24DRAFT_598081 [Lasiosphaeria ovina]
MRVTVGLAPASVGHVACLRTSRETRHSRRCKTSQDRILAVDMREEAVSGGPAFFGGYGRVAHWKDALKFSASSIYARASTSRPDADGEAEKLLSEAGEVGGVDGKLASLKVGGLNEGVGEGQPGGLWEAAAQAVSDLQRALDRFKKECETEEGRTTGNSIASIYFILSYAPEINKQLTGRRPTSSVRCANFQPTWDKNHPKHLKASRNKTAVIIPDRTRDTLSDAAMPIILSESPPPPVLTPYPAAAGQGEWVPWSLPVIWVGFACVLLLADADAQCLTAV